MFVLHQISIRALPIVSYSNHTIHVVLPQLSQHYVHHHPNIATVHHPKLLHCRPNQTLKTHQLPNTVQKKKNSENPSQQSSPLEPPNT